MCYTHHSFNATCFRNLLWNLFLSKRGEVGRGSHLKGQYVRCLFKTVPPNKDVFLQRLYDFGEKVDLRIQKEKYG